MSATFVSLDGIFPLSVISDEQLEKFDCGNLSLNDWLLYHARGNEANGGSRTFVLISVKGEIAGFYSLANDRLEHKGIRAVLKRNMPDHIPVILLGRLAVAKDYQGHGIGRALVRHAIETACKASVFSGAALLLTEPINESAASFYLHVGFEKVGKESPFLAIRIPLQQTNPNLTFHDMMC